jgi:hypothetical protein
MKASTKECELQGSVSRISNQAAKNTSDLNNALCGWEYSGEPEYVWNTGCGNKHVLTTGTPKDNDYQYCPHCGKVISSEVEQGSVAVKEHVCLLNLSLDGTCFVCGKRIKATGKKI